MKRWLNASVIGVLALTAPISAQRPATSPASATDVLPFAATERSLPNGLKVIVVPTGFPNLVSMQIPVQTGSRNEPEPGKSGFAHFFEHLMFRGTPNTPPEKFRQVMTSAGSRDNAGTGDDYTIYYTTFAKEDLEPVVAVYADMFQNLAYSESDFKTEARAILGEYNKNSANPYRKLFEVQREKFYQAHTYKHTTMGFIKDIENMPNEYAYSKVFFDRWYRPQYTTVVVAGDVTPEQVIPLIEKYWGPWKAGTQAGVAIPKEPAPRGPLYAHAAWDTETLPIVSVGFAAPAFDESSKDTAATEMIASLFFGRTSDLYKKLVVAEQKVDELEADVPNGFDPALFTVLARVKSPADAIYVRDQILTTAAQARERLVPAERLEEAKSYTRYSFARTLDSTERIASTVGGYAAYKGSYATVNNYYRTLASLAPEDVQRAARTYFTDQSLIVTTLGKAALPAGIDRLPSLASLQPAALSGASSRVNVPPLQTRAATAAVPLVLQKSVLPQLNMKLLFTVGSAHDPVGKEGLAALTAELITEGGSRELTIDAIRAALYPMAGSFRAQTDKEMTAFTGVIHRDHWQKFLAAVLPQLVDPGIREADFKRVKEAQLNALLQDLRSNNEEELGKERLQTNLYRGTPYGHVSLGTVAGLNAVTVADVKQFARQMYTRANLTIGINGDASDDLVRAVQSAVAALPEGPTATRVKVEAVPPNGTEVEVLEKDTRATAISLGFPIGVTRAHPDFAALSVARAWLGDHRNSTGKLYQRIREVRGMNYGDYAYIEAFPRGMFQFFPDPNIARQRQIFEVWIRPVVPVNAHMALRIAINELNAVVQNGMTREAFETTRGFLMKNVYVMTARQDEQLGYALDSKWYGIGEFTAYMREGLSKLTLEQVNAAIKRHLTPTRLSVVIIAKDAQRLQDALASDAPSPIQYDGEKPPTLLEEDKRIGTLKLNIPRGNVRITPIAEVFAK